MRKARGVVAIIGVLALTFVLFNVRTKLIRPARSPLITPEAYNEPEWTAEDAPNRITVVGARLYRISETSLERGEARMLVETASRLEGGAAEAATLNTFRGLVASLLGEP